MTRHQLIEHVPYRAALPRSVVDTLNVQFRDQIAVQLGDAEGDWTLRPGSHVGTIRIEDHEFLIRPKVRLRNLLAMMDVEVPSETWRREVVGLAEDPDLLAVMARLFCVACEDATRRGLRRSYVTMHDRLVSPRGRIDVASIARRPGLQSPVPCQFDEHTADIPLNQLLRAAVSRARRVPALGASWQRRLLMQEAELEGISGSSTDWSWVDRWEPAPMERHYETAVRIAYLLLSGSSPQSRFGDSPTSTFLLDMNNLFEAWVGKRMRTAYPGHHIEEQARLHLDIDRQVQMRPDIVVRSPDDDEVVAVIDCKYKLLHDGDGRNGDYYQALAYATAYGLNEAWLIYARMPGEITAKDVVVRHAGTRLRTFGIDLTGPIETAVEQVHEVAERIERSSPKNSLVTTRM